MLARWLVAWARIRLQQASRRIELGGKGNGAQASQHGPALKLPQPASASDRQTSVSRVQALSATLAWFTDAVSRVCGSQHRQGSAELWPELRRVCQTAAAFGSSETGFDRWGATDRTGEGRRPRGYRPPVPPGLPRAPWVAGALLLGLVAYGISLALFVVALRHLGTARTGAYFSGAPFFGAALASVARRTSHAGPAGGGCVDGRGCLAASDRAACALACSPG